MGLIYILTCLLPKNYHSFKRGKENLMYPQASPKSYHQCLWQIWYFNPKFIIYRLLNPINTPSHQQCLGHLNCHSNFLNEVHPQLWAPHKLPNIWPLEVYTVASNLITYCAYNVSPMPNFPDPHRFYHSIAPFCMGSHCECPSWIHFLNDSLNVVHTRPIPTSTS